MFKRKVALTLISVFLLSITFALLSVQKAQASYEPTIVTVVGNGVPGYSGDGGSAAKAQLNYPSAIIFDKTGNMYIADSTNHRVRKVDVNGVITTIAGNGTDGYSGDGGPATAAQLRCPNALALDGDGNLFIADLLSYCIRKVDANGTISTIAGTGYCGYSGDNGAAISGQFTGLFGLAFDSKDNLYVADFLRIRKVNSSGIISTIAGSGRFDHTGDGGLAINADVGAPWGLTISNNGDLYFTDNGNNCVRKIDNTGKISTVAGIGMPNVGGYSGDGGPATSARLNFPQAVIFNNTGNMYIADSQNNCIREVGSTGIISTVVGNGIKGYSGDNGNAKLASLFRPCALAFDPSGNMYIADGANHCIRKVIWAVQATGEKPDQSVNNKSIKLQIGSSKMLVGSIEKDIDPGYQTMPEIINGSSFVPIRAIVENKGGTVDWDNAEQMVTIYLNNIQIRLQIGSICANVNGVDKYLNVAPYISNTGRSMLPLRFVSESLGFTVIWNDIDSTITIQ